MDFDNYQELLSDPENLAYQILRDFNLDNESNPFLVAKKLNINIFLMDLSEDLYSFYTKPNKSDYSSSILNGSLPIQRLRYNLALQIYFHLGNYNNVAYYKNHEKSKLIDNAKTFAACFLLPDKKLEEAIKPYLSNNGKIKYSDIIYIADHFGVSFKTTAFRIFYKFNNIEGIESVEQLRNKIGPHITYSKDRKTRVPDYQIHDLKYIKEMTDCLSFLPVEQIEEIMKIKMVRDVIYGDLKTAEQIDFDINDINNIIATYKVTGIATIESNSSSEKILTLQDLVQGQLDAYNFIYSPESKHFANPELSKYLMKHLHILLFDKVKHGTVNFNAGTYVNELTPTRTVDFLFQLPKEKDIEKTKEKFQSKLDELLAQKDSLTISEYIDKSIEIFFCAYTSQMFNDGNSRVSKTLLNYLLYLKGIPSSFSVADSIREPYLDAIAQLGYDQRIQYQQEIGSFPTRVINKKGQIGKYSCNSYGFEIVEYENEQREYDPDEDTLEYYVSNLFVPPYLKDRLKNKMEEPHWEPYREIDYKPLQVVIYKAIMSSYIDCLKSPTIIPNKDINIKKEI